MMNRSNGQLSSVEDFDSYLDMSMLSSPFSSANSSSTNLSRPNSTIQPSFPYEQYPQTVLPSSISDDFFTTGASSSFSMSTDLLDMDTELNPMMPPFFFPETPTASANTIDPSSTVFGTSDLKFEQTLVPQPPPMFDGKRVYAGIHTQRAAYEKSQMMQRAAAAAAAKAETAASAATPQFIRESTTSSTMSQDSNIDKKIDNILNSMRVPKISLTPNSPGNILPNIQRMKKEEEEMDEDERLLASEAGKKLSSKERRQLRNKVSARAFRSRRKEYIGQLEQEVANKTAENTDLRAENLSLKSELTQLQDLTRSLLRSPAFSQFLENWKIPEQVAPAATSAPLESLTAATTATATGFPEPIPDLRKDINPNMVDDWALSYSSGIPVPGAPNWAMNMNTQVFAVTSLPQGPPALQDLSGKVIRPQPDSFFDWSQFPAPCDGFSPNRSMTSIPEAMEVEQAEGQHVVPEASTYVAPENLADLYSNLTEKPNEPEPTSYKAVAEKIERLAPGTGLDSLLTNLEKVITGEARPEELFEGVPPEVMVSPLLEPVDRMEEVEEMEMLEAKAEKTEGHRDRCRDVAMMVEMVGAFRRVGSICGL